MNCDASWRLYCDMVQTFSTQLFFPSLAHTHTPIHTGVHRHIYIYIWTHLCTQYTLAAACIGHYHTANTAGVPGLLPVNVAVNCESEKRASCVH